MLRQIEKSPTKKVFDFLRNFHILGYDLDIRSGIMHALLHTIIGRLNPDNPAGILARIQQEVAAANQTGGTLTVDLFSEDIRSAFVPRHVQVMPDSLRSIPPPEASGGWDISEYAEPLVVANLLGGWSDNSDNDRAIIGMLTAGRPNEWLRKMREVLQRPESPLAHKSGVWTVKDRSAFWKRSATRIFADVLRRFRECAVKVLVARDPQFDLEPEDRFAAQLHGKVSTYSWAIRAGIADTLAILGSNIVALPNCEPSAGELTAAAAVRDILKLSDWKLWATLDHLLPLLAEASPNAFLEAVEEAIRRQPSPFDAIFAQERDVFSGGTHITGLLWALETLAWGETYLVRVAVLLAALAARDPGGQWANRPAESLTTIFLPWLPQTHASIEKRRVAIQTILDVHPDVGWQLLMSLLPNRHTISSGSHKPKWRKELDTSGNSVSTTQEE